MSNTIAARVTMRGLDTRFKYVITALTDGLAQTVSDASLLIMEAAKAMAPVDTGALRDSIDSVMTESTAQRATARVAPHTDYAAYVEFGTIHMSAQPYMRPAFDEQGSKAVEQMQAEIKKNIVEALQNAR